MIIIKKNDKETIKNDNSINKLKLIPKPEFNNNPNSIQNQTKQTNFELKITKKLEINIDSIKLKSIWLFQFKPISIL